MSMNLKLITYIPDQISFLVDAPNYDTAVEAAIKANSRDANEERCDRSNYRSKPVDISTLGEIMATSKYCVNRNGVLVLLK